MTLPTKTLLDQLRKTVEWFHPKRWMPLGPAGDLKIISSAEFKDHIEACLDILEELEGRDRKCNMCGQTGLDILFCLKCVSRRDEITEEDTMRIVRMDLRRLHSLIKGCASREAMDLIRAMIGEEK
jgi:hypothetical protein